MSNSGRFQPGRTPHNSGRRGKGVRTNKDSPYVAETPTQKIRAQAEFTKMVKSLSTVNGFVLGLQDLDIPMILATGEDGELWSKKARTTARLLNKFATKLKEGADNAISKENRPLADGGAELKGDHSESQGAGGTPDSATGVVSDPAGAPAEEPGP